jgi:hypothetical protein
MEHKNLTKKQKNIKVTPIMLASEESLKQIWNNKKEDKAWKNL